MGAVTSLRILVGWVERSEAHQIALGGPRCARPTLQLIHGQRGAKKTAGLCFLPALAFLMGAVGAAAEARSGRHFEGPYHITIQPFQRVRATVTSTFRFPDLDAHEWWAAFPWPPEFEGQPSARVQVRIAEAPFAEVDQITDESAMHRPLVALHWFPDGNDATHALTAEATYDVTITRRTLEPGAGSTPVRRLSPAERSVFLGATTHFDFSSPKFQAWLRKEDLRRTTDERDLDFAHRAMETLVRTHTYRSELKSNRSASAVAAAGWSDCGGLSTIYVSILRANGIPARCLTGRSIDPNTTHVKMDFYAEDVGWVPGDPAVAIGSHRADAGFGREHFDMVITHFDLVRLGGRYQWLQGIGTLQARNTEGSGGRITLDHAMRVEVLPPDNGPTPAASRAVEPEQRGPATARPRNRRRRS
jgi:transglutaminase-like putative cysteine protease